MASFPNFTMNPRMLGKREKVAGGGKRGQRRLETGAPTIPINNLRVSHLES